MVPAAAQGDLRSFLVLSERGVAGAVGQIFWIDRRIAGEDQVDGPRSPQELSRERSRDRLINSSFFCVNGALRTVR
jgi:hypothetical protein